jgi:hypothetical protein
MRRRIKREVEEETETATVKTAAADRTADGNGFGASTHALTAWPSHLMCPFCKELTASDSAKILRLDARACSKCGAGLSRLNVPNDSALDPTPKQVSAASPGSSPTVPRGTVGAPETITVTWGQETFTPKQFHTFHVGPFVATGAIRPDETRAQAMERLYEDLRLFAEKERERKVRAFLDAIGTMYGSKEAGK